MFTSGRFRQKWDDHDRRDDPVTLTEFLKARFDEDEAAARGPWLGILGDVDDWWNERSDDEVGELDQQGDDVKGLAKTIMQIESARGVYARVLAEVAVKRRIVARHGRHLGLTSDEDYRDGCDTVRLLALPYADHPDFDEEWRL